jgi:mono/diheme cytochrome c family protein
LGRSFNPTIWSAQAYANAWHRWPGYDNHTAPPTADELREHYGLHPALYPNGNLPMGLRVTHTFFTAGLSTDCLMCHGSSIAGKSYVGLGNTSLDMQALYEDLAVASGRSSRTPFTFSNVRGTTEAGAMAVFLFALREPDLSLRSSKLNLGLHDDMCEDVPAWWLLKKKKTMYHTGSHDARSVRALMQFMLSPLNSASTIMKEEETFRDIQAYLLSLEPPRYPFPIDTALAGRGETIFKKTCARCHGTYGKDWTYPNKVVPIHVIGTDRSRYDGFSKTAGEAYNKSWFGHEKSGWLAEDYKALATAGYQAPPLDGIWATAPYFHNGSVPTVYHVLNSKARPRIYTRSFRTDKEAYDPVKLGWKIEVLDRAIDSRYPAYERRKIYDTTQPGRGNGGHPFGDDLSDDERLAVIEYLKTL